jgi:hypothetical protein
MFNVYQYIYPLNASTKYFDLYSHHGCHLHGLLAQRQPNEVNPAMELQSINGINSPAGLQAF